MLPSSIVSNGSKTDSPRAGYDGRKLDCFSLGVALYTCLSGIQPLICMEPWSNDQEGGEEEFKSIEELAESVFFDEMTYPDWAWRNADPMGQSLSITRKAFLIFRTALQLVKNLLEYDPAQRYTVANALYSNWIIKSLVDLRNLYSKNVLRE